MRGKAVSPYHHTVGAALGDVKMLRFSANHEVVWTVCIVSLGVLRSGQSTKALGIKSTWYG